MQTPNQMNRAQRRAAKSLVRQKAATLPEDLRELPREEWPHETIRQMTHPPMRVWQSKRWLVQLYEETSSKWPAGVQRMSVSRTVLRTDGHWTDGITWDDLQNLKNEIGFGDKYAIEIYPRDRDLIAAANMRHLWILDDPLPIGWFRK